MWQQLGRQVRRGKRGLKILVPHHCNLNEEENGEPVYGVAPFGLGIVFDIAQTVEQLPERPMVGALVGDTDLAYSMSQRLTAVLQEQGLTIATGALPGTLRGLYERPATPHHCAGRSAADGRVLDSGS